MTDIKKNLKDIFKNSALFSESETKQLNEKLWDDVKDEWSKGKKIGQAPIKSASKSLADKIGARIFNKKDDVPKAVAGTGSPSKSVVAPVAPVTGSTSKSVVAPVSPVTGSASKTVVAPVATVTGSPSKPKDEIIKPRSNKSGVILNPIGIELHGVEDPNQKEKKIINPLKTLLKDKNTEFINAFNKIKDKNGITSKNSTDEISAKDPSDITRKTIIRNLFAIKFYKDAYINLLENLRKLNIISENKIDSGVFQQAILASLEYSKQKHGRRFSANLKKINNLSKNENDVKLGMKKGDASFKRDMNNIFKGNKDKFTMLNIQESIKFEGFFTEEFVEAEAPKTVNPNKEDATIRSNDYVWWLNEAELQNVMNDPAKRKLLTYQNIPIEFEDMGNGKFVNGTGAQIKYLKGQKAGESEKIDIRNIDIPQNIAKSLINFGKVLSSTIDIDTRLQDAEDQLNTPGITAPDKEKIKKEIGALQKKKEKMNQTGSVAKIQKFVARDLNNLEKTIVGGKTKITPEPNSQPVEVNTKDLVKMNKEGKSKLLTIIGKTSIALHSVLTLLSPNTLHKFLSWIDTSLGDLAKKFGDLAGSKSQTNF